MPKVEQPTAAPTRKVTAAAGAGAAAVFALALLGAVGVEVPGVDVAALPVTEALAVLVAVASGYLTRERA